MAKRPLLNVPWEEPSESDPASESQQESTDEPQYDGLKKSGKALTDATGLVLAVPHESLDIPLIEKVNVAAPKGVFFHCCGQHQQTETFTTRVICSKCGKVYQLILKQTPSRLRGKFPVQILPSGSWVSLSEEYKEQMTTHGFTIPVGLRLKVATDHGVLPVDRTQEILVEFKPSSEEWPSDKEPPQLCVPVPVALLNRED